MAQSYLGRAVDWACRSRQAFCGSVCGAREFDGWVKNAASGPIGCGAMRSSIRRCWPRASIWSERRSRPKPGRSRRNGTMSTRVSSSAAFPPPLRSVRIPNGERSIDGSPVVGRPQRHGQRSRFGSPDRGEIAARPSPCPLPQGEGSKLPVQVALQVVVFHRQLAVFRLDDVADRNDTPQPAVFDDRQMADAVFGHQPHDGLNFVVE